MKINENAPIIEHRDKKEEEKEKKESKNIYVKIAPMGSNQRNFCWQISEYWLGTQWIC